MTDLSVSTYSLREQLGPTSLVFTGPDGVERTFGAEHEKLFDLHEVPGRIRERYGVERLETVAFQFAGVDDPEIERFGAALRDAGVELLNVAIDDGDLLEADADARAAHVATITAWIERFVGIGARFVRVNPGSPFSPHHGDTPPAHLVDALRGLGELANRLGARLLVENHGGPSSDPAWMNALLDAVGREHLGLLLDLGNFDALLAPLMATMLAQPGEQPAGDPFADLDLDPLYDGIDALASRAELVHVKAHEVADDGSIGLVDLDRAVAILHRHGYDGPLTIEYEGSGGDPWAKTGVVLDATRRLAAATADA
jgi:sugar phosphate isomerase/epimerase